MCPAPRAAAKRGAFAAGGHLFLGLVPAHGRGHRFFIARLSHLFLAAAPCWASDPATRIAARWPLQADGRSSAVGGETRAPLRHGEVLARFRSTYA
jgi:hypothetical protein